MKGCSLLLSSALLSIAIVVCSSASNFKKARRTRVRNSGERRRDHQQRRRRYRRCVPFSLFLPSSFLTAAAVVVQLAMAMAARSSVFDGVPHCLSTTPHFRHSSSFQQPITGTRSEEGQLSLTPFLTCAPSACTAFLTRPRTRRSRPNRSSSGVESRASSSFAGREERIKRLSKCQLGGLTLGASR